jgi:hypothetical protein
MTDEMLNTLGLGAGVHSLDARYRCSVSREFQGCTTPLLEAVRRGNVEMVKVLLTCENIELDLWCDEDHNAVLHLYSGQASEVVPVSSTPVNLTWRQRMQPA